MKTLNEWIREMLTWGTPACGVACAVAGVVIAALWLAVGFWQTLFIALMAAAGAFLGGVKDKNAFIKRLFNRVFPPKNNA